MSENKVNDKTFIYHFFIFLVLTKAWKEDTYKDMNTKYLGLTVKYQIRK